MNYLVIYEMKVTDERRPDRLEKRYGLVDGENGKVLLPTEYEFILVLKGGCFVWAQRRNPDYTNTYEVYDIQENGELKLVPEEEPTDFLWSMMSCDLTVMRIDGKLRVVKDLRKNPS